MTHPDPAGPRSFEELVQPLPEPIRRTAQELRRIVKGALPDADEGIYGGARIGMALYSVSGSNNVVCGIQPTAGSCKLFFHGWQALVARGIKVEGAGKHARHIKLRVPEDVDADAATRMIVIARSALGY